MQGTILGKRKRLTKGTKGRQYQRMIVTNSGKIQNEERSYVVPQQSKRPMDEGDVTL